MCTRINEKVFRCVRKPQLIHIEQYCSHLKATYTNLCRYLKVEVIQRVTTQLNKVTTAFEGWFREIRRWLEQGSARHLFE